MKQFIKTALSTVLMVLMAAIYVTTACSSDASPQEHEFVGISEQRSFEEALDDALKQLRQAMAEEGIADNQASWKLVEITGRVGGIAGFDELQVKITATFLTLQESSNSQ
jgi:hypothetical protein